MNERFNVEAVSLKTGDRRVIARNLTEKNAEAVVMMAVMRRGVDEEFFVPVRADESAKRAPVGDQPAQDGRETVGQDNKGKR